jgi:antirestriction protein ArdC
MKHDIYAEVTNRSIAQFEQGVLLGNPYFFPIRGFTPLSP